MAGPRYSRIGERSQGGGPSATLIITGSILVGCLLIGAWVITSPAAIADSDNGDIIETVDTTPTGVRDSRSETPVTEEDRPAQEEEDPARETPANTDEETPATTTGEETPATTTEEKTPATTTEEETPATTTEEETPATTIEEETPATNPEEETSVTTAEETPATEEETPATTTDETPALEEESSEEESEPTATSKASPVTIPDLINSDAELTFETQESNSTKFKTQVQESTEEKAGEVTPGSTSTLQGNSTGGALEEIPKWKLCSFEGAQDFIPCLDNKAALKKLPSTKHYEHRERHCPSEEELPKCLLPLPAGYKVPIKWPDSRDAVWFSNVPHTELASYKSDQNWVKLSENKQKLIFPGGGTQFKTEHGALHYIEFIEEIVPDVAWGKHVRTVLDVGCGVASFGGYLFEKDVLTMSLAPKDEHEAQVQFALERGIMAISGVMGTQRLQFPSNVYDVVHCARCRVPWEIEGGKLLLELNRLLRPGGFFIWSATPVYWDDEENTRIWKDTSDLLARMQWTMLKKSIDLDTKVGVAIFQKPKDNDLYTLRASDAQPPFCAADDNPDAAWYVPMKACMHHIPSGEGVRGTSWPSEWPLRVVSTPAWLSPTEKGIYGKPLSEDFRTDTDHWKRIVHKSYLTGLDIQWESVRKVMDMKAGYGGFAAALVAHPLWTMNIVPVTEPDTLPIIFDRGLIGMYHNWCEPHSTYPRSYDLMHSDHLLSSLTKWCKTTTVLMEMDRILRPDGWAIIRDTAETILKVEALAKSLHWEVVHSSANGDSRLLVAQKKFWRPEAALEVDF